MGIVMMTLWLAALLVVSGTANPTARVFQGEVIGSVMTSPNGRQFTAYRGIPYAKPPVGDLRFRNPQPADPWSGKLNATVDSPLCIQKNVLVPNAVVAGQEDCLYLNVYSHPELNGLPVIVYLHGGAWFSGSGVSYLTSPELLMGQDVVVVTINYRLGVFGFLSTGDVVAPGNFGLKDQVLALRWVRDNVAAFGGDPSAVTIFGQSAGAGSVHLHMLSPMSNGLFHRAISNSGSALAAWAFPTKEPLALAWRHAALVGCGDAGNSSQQLAACLRAADATLLADTTDQLKTWSVDPLSLYRPVVETYGAWQERFLPALPLDILRDALKSPEVVAPFTTVPWLTGIVGAEGIVRAVPILTNASLLADLNSRLDELMPTLLELEGSAGDMSQAVWQRIKEHFFHDGDVVLGDDNAQAFIDIYSDRSMNHPLYNTVLYQRMAGHRNIFVYSFEYKGLYTYTSVFANTTKDYGVSHCDDLLYLVPAPALFPAFPQGSPDWKVADDLVRLWTNFAKYGQPTPPPARRSHHAGRDSCAQNVDAVWWPSSLDNQTLPYLQITADSITSRRSNQDGGVLKFCMRDNLLSDRMAFWSSLPLLENSLRYL